MSRYRIASLLLAAVTCSGLAAAAPAQAAGVKATGTVKPLARSCATSRVAEFRISLKHLKIGKTYLVQWDAPTRSGGTQVTQIPIVATKTKYAVARQTSRAATPLLARKFNSTITIYLLKATKKQTTDVEQSTSMVTVPRCTPRR